MTDEAAFEASLRRGRRIRLVVLAAVIASPLVYVTYRFWHQHHKNAEYEARVRRETMATPEQVAELKKLMPQLRTAIDAASTQIKADVTRQALDAALASDGGRCPYDIAGTFGLHDDVGKQLAMMDHRSAAYLVERLPLTIDGLDEARGDLRIAAEHIASDQVQKTDVEDVEKDAADLGAALIVVGTQSRAITVGGTYTPGHIDGDAFLYEYGAHAIMCAGHISVSTPDSVMVEYRAAPGDLQAGDQAADAKLEAALYDAEVGALASTLHAVPR